VRVADGLFWQKPAGAREFISAIRPRLPGGDWCTPKASDLPDLSAAKVIAIDTETKDPDLKTKGPGFRRDGHIAGLAVGTDDGLRMYLPMRHALIVDQPNMDPDIVLRWARDNLTGSQPKVGANILYDLEGLACEGVDVQGPFRDVQVAEPLIDETAKSYALERLAKKYVGQGKVDDDLYDWLAGMYGGKPTRSDQIGNVYRAPPELVAPYAIGDIDLPLQIWEKQQQKIREDDLGQILDIECRLIPMLLAMRMRGVRIDMSKAHEVEDRLNESIATKTAELAKLGVDIWAADSIARYCDGAGIEYPRTGKGAPSFVSAWLERHHHPVMNEVQELRKLSKHAGTFIHSAILGHAIGDRIFGQFHALRTDTNGAVSGRFASSLPNLQNIPARDPVLGPLIRSLFIPDEGELWASDDWSQIEYRLLVHYATGPAALLAKREFCENPDTDYHSFVAELTGIDRKPAKNINFGLAYGMGQPKLAANLGVSAEEAAAIFETYHAKVPYVRELSRAVKGAANRRGYIRTLLGRRRRWNLWESDDFATARKNKPLHSRQAAVNLWGKVTRAGVHKALNSLLQGGAADIMKKAMVDIWDAGVCDVLGAPLSTVHDELNWSMPDTLEGRQAHAEAVRIMETCVELDIPLLCDAAIGAHWGECK
jgi:DNA polymerase I-like protein with 3'-5' exonuclease and polymerase domains